MGWTTISSSRARRRVLPLDRSHLCPVHGLSMVASLSLSATTSPSLPLHTKYRLDRRPYGRRRFLHGVLRQMKRLKDFLIEHSKDICALKGCAPAQTAMYRNFILPFFRQFSWMLANFIAKSSRYDAVHGKHVPCIGPIDIFLWATLFCTDEEIAEALWYRCEQPVRAALLGAVVCKRVAARLAYGYGQTRLRDRATRLEQRACALLGYAQPQVADDIIALKLVEGEPYAQRPPTNGRGHLGAVLPATFHARAELHAAHLTERVCLPGLLADCAQVPPARPRASRRA